MAEIGLACDFELGDVTRGPFCFCCCVAACIELLGLSKERSTVAEICQSVVAVSTSVGELHRRARRCILMAKQIRAAVAAEEAQERGEGNTPRFAPLLTTDAQDMAAAKGLTSVRAESRERDVSYKQPRKCNWGLRVAKIVQKFTGGRDGDTRWNFAGIRS